MCHTAPDDLRPYNAFCFITTHPAYSPNSGPAIMATFSRHFALTYEFVMSTDNKSISLCEEEIETIAVYRGNARIRISFWRCSSVPTCHEACFATKCSHFSVENNPHRNHFKVFRHLRNAFESVSVVISAAVGITPEVITVMMI